MKCIKYVLAAGKLHRNLPTVLLPALAVTICILAGTLIIFGDSSQAAEDRNIYKYYTSVEIKSGDTLWSIASKYISEDYADVQEYVKEVKALNGLGDDNIHSGQFLIVPYYSYDLK